MSLRNPPHPARQLPLLREPPSPFASRVLARLRAQGAPQDIGPLLELGAGSGRDALLFARGGLTTIAVDLLPGRAVREPLLSWLISDLKERLPLADHSIGIVFSHLVLSCDFTDSEVKALLLEVMRVLRPGGRFFLAVRSTADPTYIAGPQRGAGYIEIGGGGLHFFSKRSLRRHLEMFSVEAILEVMETLEGETFGVLEVYAKRTAEQASFP